MVRLTWAVAHVHFALILSREGKFTAACNKFFPFAAFLAEMISIPVPEEVGVLGVLLPIVFVAHLAPEALILELNNTVV